MPPAARLSDMHTCPLVTGIVPHVGGPISMGFPTVLIGTLAAARVGDLLTCVGPPDAIALGSMTVQIGGMLAARLGDPTVHGGVIIVGFPQVLIGDGAFPYPVTMNPDGTIQIGNHLTIQGTPEYQAQVLADISTIAMTTNPDGTWSQGRETMDRINNGSHDVTIRDWDPADPGNQCSTTNDAYTPGTGADSTIYYDPTYEPPTAADPSVNRPGDVGLHHEMGHAASASEGNWTNDPATNPNNPHMEEERNIALDNEYRDARGIPRRADHQHL